MRVEVIWRDLHRRTTLSKERNYFAFKKSQPEVCRAFSHPTSKTISVTWCCTQKKDIRTISDIQLRLVHLKFEIFIFVVIWSIRSRNLLQSVRDCSVILWVQDDVTLIVFVRAEWEKAKQTFLTSKYLLLTNTQLVRMNTCTEKLVYKQHNIIYE